MKIESRWSIEHAAEAIKSSHVVYNDNGNYVGLKALMEYKNACVFNSDIKNGYYHFCGKAYFGNMDAHPYRSVINLSEIETEEKAVEPMIRPMENGEDCLASNKRNKWLFGTYIAYDNDEKKFVVCVNGKYKGFEMCRRPQVEVEPKLEVDFDWGVGKLIDFCHPEFTYLDYTMMICDSEDEKVSGLIIQIRSDKSNGLEVGMRIDKCLKTNFKHRTEPITI